ncbi:hypothetical protein D3C75_1289540 [compost metagenome]
MVLRRLNKVGKYNRQHKGKGRPVNNNCDLALHHMGADGIGTVCIEDSRKKRERRIIE